MIISDAQCRRGWVFALKRDFPDLDFSLNGVVDGCHEAAAVIEHQHAGQNLHGVMIGRAAYHYPWHSLSDADRTVFGCSSNAASSRRQVGRIPTSPQRSHMCWFFCSDCS